MRRVKDVNEESICWKVASVCFCFCHSLVQSKPWIIETFWDSSSEIIASISSKSFFDESTGYCGYSGSLCHKNTISFKSEYNFLDQCPVFEYQNVAFTQVHCWVIVGLCTLHQAVTKTPRLFLVGVFRLRKSARLLHWLTVFCQSHSEWSTFCARYTFTIST